VNALNPPEKTADGVILRNSDLGLSGRLIERALTLSVPAGRDYQVLLTGLAPGNWTIRGQDGRHRFNVRAEAGKNTALAVAPGGSHTVQPETIPGALRRRVSNAN